MTEKLPFQEEPEEFEPTKGVKLQRKKSFVGRQGIQNHERQTSLEGVAQEIVAKRQEKLSKAFDLGKRYKDMISDKTVPSQASELKKSQEAEVISEFVKFAIEANNDEDEMEGMGSVTAITLLFKVLLMMRDQHNILDHKYHQLEKYTERLEAKLNRLSSTTDEPSK